MGGFSARLSRDIAELATTPATADEQLPQLLEQLRRGDAASPATQSRGGTVAAARRNAEIAQALAAVASLSGPPSARRPAKRAAQWPPPGIRRAWPSAPVTPAAAAPAD